jgi:hypothetical protein
MPWIKKVDLQSTISAALFEITNRHINRRRVGKWLWCSRLPGYSLP